MAAGFGTSLTLLFERSPGLQVRRSAPMLAAVPSARCDEGDSTCTTQG